MQFQSHRYFIRKSASCKDHYRWHDRFLCVAFQLPVTPLGILIVHWYYFDSTCYFHELRDVVFQILINTGML